MRRSPTHILAAIVSIALMIGIAYDRRDPVSFVDGDIIPDPAYSGEEVTIRWKTIWHRACEAELSRDVIGSDLIVRPYLKRFIRIPTQLGLQTAEQAFELPANLPVMRDDQPKSGLTAYRILLRFHDCGLTSWLVPLDLRPPPVFFQVVDRNPQ